MGRPRKPIWKTQQWPQDWKRSILIPTPKKGSTKEGAEHTGQLHSSLISHASKVMLKILHARLQHYGNHEIPDVKLGLEKEEKLEIKLPTSTGL